MLNFNSIQEGLQYLFSDEYGNSQVTAVYPNGDLNDPWFYVHEVANCLGYNGASYQLIKYLPDGLAGVINCHIRSYNGVEQVREVLIISLHGLMELIGRSRAARAEQFRSWVYGVLIPGLYKHPEIVQQLNKEVDDLNAKLESSIWKVNAYRDECIDLRKEKIALNKQINELNGQVDELSEYKVNNEPFNELGKTLYKTETLVSINELAKILSNNLSRPIGEHGLRELLRASGHLMKEGNHDVASQYSISNGFMQPIFDPASNKMAIGVTPKGITHFIYWSKNIIS